eukprot:scaffold1993_cov236-Chaetoceros_neogracile.AAC.7
MYFFSRRRRQKATSTINKCDTANFVPQHHRPPSDTRYPIRKTTFAEEIELNNFYSIDHVPTATHFLLEFPREVADNR